MIGEKVERIERLLRALDMADGKEDFVIHRAQALTFIKNELRQRMENPEAYEDAFPTRTELEMSLKSLHFGPPTFKRKNNLEILEILLAAQNELNNEVAKALN